MPAPTTVNALRIDFSNQIAAGPTGLVGGAGKTGLARSSSFDSDIRVVVIVKCAPGRPFLGWDSIS